MSRFFSLLLPCRDADTDDIDVPDRLLRGASPQREASLPWPAKSAMSTDTTSSGAVRGPMPGTVSRHLYVSSAFSDILRASSRTPWSSKWTTLLTGGLQEWYHPIVEELSGSLSSDARIRKHYMKWGIMRRTLIDNGARKALAVLASAALVAGLVPAAAFGEVGGVFRR